MQPVVPSRPVALSLDVCGHRRTLKILAFPGSSRPSVQTCPNIALSRNLCAHAHWASRPSVQGTHLSGVTMALRGHWAPTLITPFSLAGPSAPCVCLRGAWLTTQLVSCVRSPCMFLETHHLPCTPARSHTLQLHQRPAASGTTSDSGNIEQH